MNTPTMKTCTNCTQHKPATRQYFHYDNSTRDGYRCWCITCTAEYMKNHVPSNEMPRLTNEELAEIETKAQQRQTRFMAQQRKEQIRLAAQNAPYASIGIIIDGIKINTPIKVCSKCKTQKPATADYFHCRKQNKDGLKNCCKVCTAKSK